ncbi:uncharacterized protein LOC100179806 isoform X3 [Ciona intestinalis]
MYTMKDLLSWWEVPAIAHFFSLFKSCFSLTDFTIEELEEALLTDGETDASTAFTSKLLMELLQGCYNNSNISVTNYHETLIDIMKRRWEIEDGRVNPLSSIYSDFHSLPTQLKVQIIHRLTEYRLDAQDVDEKLSGLNPSDLRLEPLGSDRNGSKYWYFFGVRLYKETPPLHKSGKRRKRNGSSPSVKRSKSNDPFWGFPKQKHLFGKKKHKKKGWKKKKREAGEDYEYFSSDRLSESKWEVVCYNVNDWKQLAKKMVDGISEKEEALHQLITENFLPNLPKIVEDMENQKRQKLQAEPRRSSCRLLAKKLYEEDGGIELKREEQEIVRRKEEDKRLEIGFEKMLRVELDRRKREAYSRWRKEQEEQRRQRLEDGLLLDDDSSSGSESNTDPISPPQRSRLKRESSSNQLHQRKDSAVKMAKNTNSKKSKTAVPTENKTKQKVQNETCASPLPDISDHEYAVMQKTWEVLDNNPEAWPFQTPVEESYAPGYHSVIKRPMDLSTIEDKLKQQKYSSVKDFKEDITLMFNNCRLYNGPDSEYTEVANQLDELFQTTLSKNLGEKQTSVKSTTNQKTAASRKKSPSPDVALEDEEEEEEERSDNDSSSDEFTPSWVSKTQAKKMRLASRSKDLSKGKESKGRGRGRSLSRSSLKESSAPTPPKPKNTRKKAAPKRKLRGAATKWTTKDESDNSDHDAGSDSGNSDARNNGSVEKEAAPRGRGKYRRASKTKLRSKNHDSDSSEPSSLSVNGKKVEPEVETTVESNDRLTGNENIASPLKSPLSKDSDKNLEVNVKSSSADLSEKITESNPADVDSSSSSSRGSSRSQSLEKFEKLEEDAKSKPQVMWSLDYLASQARVLEEQCKKTESSSVNSRQQPIVTNFTHFLPDASKKLDIKDKSGIFSAPKFTPESNLKFAQSISEKERSQKLGKRKRKEDLDVYSFKDENSPDPVFSRLGATNENLAQIKATTPSPKQSPTTGVQRQNTETDSTQKFTKSPATPVNSTPKASEPFTQSSATNTVKTNPPTYVQSQSSYYTTSHNTLVSSPALTTTSCKPVNTYTTTISQAPPSTGYSHHAPGVPTTLPGTRTTQQSHRPSQEDRPRSQTERDNPYLARKASQDIYQDAKMSSSSPSQISRRQSLPAQSENQNTCPMPAVVHANNNVHKTNPNQTSSEPNHPSMSYKHPTSVNQTVDINNRRHSLSNYSQPDNSPTIHTKPYIKSPPDCPATQPEKKSYSQPPQYSNSNSMSAQQGGQKVGATSQKSYPMNTPTNTRAPHEPQHPPPPKQPTKQHSQNPPTPDNNVRLQKPPPKNDTQQGRMQAYEQATPAMHRSSQYHDQQNFYPQEKQVAAERSAGGYYRNSAGHYQEDNHAVAAAATMLFQNPTMANLGLPPWSLSQTQTSHNRSQPSSTSTTAKSSAMTGASHHESGNHRQPHHSTQICQSSSVSTSSHAQSNRHSSNAHRMSNKSRHQSTTSDTVGSTAANTVKYRATTAHTNNNHCPPASVATASQSGSNTTRHDTATNEHFQHKSYGDYRSYRIPPTPAPTPLSRESHTPGYSPQQHNGLLSATAGPANNTSLLHQDLTASATLRALQQQHKGDRPSPHAAASMLHYAAAVQQSQGAVAAANEQYNRLAASAHHRSNPQHAHPLAGVYHSHHNAATSTAHQAAAHLGTPWLQATGSPAPGYPSNLLPPPHMDPVYHLMQQSGMHGQYPMYSNHVMQQLHQQHLQRHMLPKY